MSPAVFIAGWIVGAASLALVLGAVVGLSDDMVLDQPDLNVEPLYVPQEWSA